jgi:RimJ/RimL family protein N-acetyltransferase
VQAFGLYQIRHDGLAIGGIGFSGPPDDGVVELGFGLIESARGNGFAAEALEALIEAALAFGAESVMADTTLDNLASQKTMLRAGMTEVSRDSELISYEAR